MEILESAYEMVVSERVVGSCTACIVTLDQNLKQLSYANLGAQTYSLTLTPTSVANPPPPPPPSFLLS
jgi:ferredoxin